MKWIRHEMDVEAARQAAMRYCEEHDLDYSRIERSQQLWDTVSFTIRKKGVVVDGLKTDIATQPDEVLYCDLAGVIHETECTKRLLGRK